jgi:carboxyl-terminal processing protease
VALVAGLVTVAFLTGGWLKRAEPAASASDVYAQARLFEDMLAAVRAHYVDSISETELYFRATSGTVDHLRDPYSVLLVGEAYKRFTERLHGVEDGIGLQLDLRRNLLYVVGTTPGSAAERDGLQPGDQLLTVDGVPTKGWNIEQAAAALRVRAGDTVTVAVRRPGEPDTLTYRLESGPLRVPATTVGALLDGGTGVVRLAVVSTEAAAELRAAVDSLRELGMRSLVLDLRSNPGGVLNQGIAIADLFLDPGQRIGTLLGRTERQTTVYTDETPQPWPDLPVAVLVDGATASAAEIVAAALQDHDRAIVVGMPSLGKGAVQSTIPLGRDVAVKLTTARWHAPSGRSIQRPAVGDSTPPAAPQEFRSDVGRRLRGASGIDPDVRVAPLAATRAERRYRQELGDLSAYREVVTRLAEETVADSVADGMPERAPRTVTVPLREELYRRLEAAGLPLPADEYAGAAASVDRDLTEGLVRAAEGEMAVRRLRMERDHQLREAMRMLTFVEASATWLGLPLWELPAVSSADQASTPDRTP